MLRQYEGPARDWCARLRRAAPGLPEPPQDLDTGDGPAITSAEEFLAKIDASRPREPQDLDASPPEEPPPEFGSIDGAALLEDLRTGWDGSSWWRSQTDLGLLALWVPHTFLSHELYTTPRLLIDSITPGSGKTTLLEHLDHLCRNGLLAASMSSAAVIPRILEKEPRTILLDEIQRTLVEGKPGHRRGHRGGQLRLPGRRHPPGAGAQGTRLRGQGLPTFAPVAMAGNSPHLPQDTIDRSIRILLMPDVDGHAEDSDWEALDAAAASWASGCRCGPTRCARTSKTPRASCPPDARADCGRSGARC